ncbi:MAG: histidine kinase [Actinomycetota bacterium]|nr:histidine kinase [Actinomycetota bacterium]
MTGENGASRQIPESGRAAVDLAGAMASPLPPRSRQVRCVLLVAVMLALPIGWRAWARFRGPSDGVFVVPSSPPWQGAVTVAEVRGASGIHVGDEVVAVDGVPLTSWADRPPAGLLEVHRRPGDHLRYLVRRNGRLLDVDVVLRRPTVHQVVITEATTAPLLLCVVGIGAFVFVCRPGDRAARVFLLLTGLVAAGAVVSPYVEVVDLVGGRGVWPFLVDRVARDVMWGALLHFTLVFPEPRPVVARRPWVLAFAYLGPFLAFAGYLALTLPGASSALERLGLLLSMSRPASYLYPPVVVVTMVMGYRALPSGPARQRLKWMLVALTVGGSLDLAFAQVPLVWLGHTIVPEEVMPLAYLPIPVAAGAAILRYRLYDIEIIVRRSLVYGGLTAAVLAIYLVTVELLDLTLGTRRGVVPLLASGLVAACIPAVRRRLQRRVGQVIYGNRDDPQEVVSRLGQRLEATADAEAILPGMVETLAHALRLPYAAVEIHQPDGEVVARASFGARPDDVVGLPLLHRGASLGVLFLAVGPGAEPFGPADRRLLNDLSRQVAVTAHGVALFAALQRSLARTVLAREEERRRLRRDLHDGLGPTLAAIVLQLEVARSLLQDDPTAAESVIGRLSSHAQSATVDVRRIVDDLRPPDLDQLGLVAAIERRARFVALPSDRLGRAGGLDVMVTADGPLGDLPAAVEVAVFRIVEEALNNVSRHSRATACRVELHVGDELEVTVSDNGRGLPDELTPGVGTGSMCERAAELGGSCTIGGASEGGTVVAARFPLQSP